MPYSQTFVIRFVLSFVILFAAAVPGHAGGDPVLDVDPGSIDRLSADPLMVSVTSVGGPSIQLRLRVDVNGNGAIDAGDDVIWIAEIDDNGSVWSPTMPVDLDPTVDAIAIDLRSFTPLGFPYSAGSYLWEAFSPGSGLSDSATFSVTQAAEPQVVSGTVTDDSMTPLGGALVILTPISEDCDDLELSAFSDASGSFAIQVPDDLPCSNRLLFAARPGFVSHFTEGISLSFGGSDVYAGQDLELAAGSHSVTGSVLYADGDAVGTGIPGQFVVAEGEEDDSFSVAFAGLDGSFAFALDDGDWFVLADSELHLALAGAVAGDADGQAVNVSGGAAVVPDILVRAVNASIRGVLYDDALVPQPGRRVEAESDYFDCPDCFFAAAVTAADGSFILGAFGEVGPDYTFWSVRPTVPIQGLVAAAEPLALSEGDHMAGHDLEHLTPTSFIVGTFETIAGDTVPDLCLWAEQYGDYVSRARVGCDGTFSIPVLDGEWQIEFGEEGPAEFFRDVDTSGFREVLTIDGEDEDLSVILGPSTTAPSILRVEPAAAAAGAQLVVEGSNFAFGGTPEVTIDGLPATLLEVRGDIGRLVVEVPGGLSGERPSVVVSDPFSGRSSEPGCFELLPGSYTPTCTISGTVTRDAGFTPLPGTLVVALDQSEDRFVRATITDGAGDYSLGLEDDTATYSMIMIPPANRPRLWGSYDGVSCSGTQDHNFLTGRVVSGRVVENGEGVPNVKVGGGGMTSFAEAVTDDNGDFSFRLAQGENAGFEFTAPSGSRFVNDNVLNMMIDGATVLPDVELTTGWIFAGRTEAADGSGLAARIRGSSADTFQLSGSAVSSSCDGSFGIALATGEHFLDLSPEFGDGGTDVDSVFSDGDERAEFDFTVFPDGPLGFDDGNPRIADESDNYGSVGQPMVLDVENLGSGAVVAFPAIPTKSGRPMAFTVTKGIGPVGDDTYADVERGLVFSRVPASADDGFLLVGSSSGVTPAIPFGLDPAIWDAGALIVDGEVTNSGAPVEGALVVLLREAPRPGECDDDLDSLVHDYAVTDASGIYTLHHPGGNLFLLVLPPRDSFPDDLSAAVGEATDVMTDLFGIDFDLSSGSALTLRVVAGDPPQPVPGARVSADGDVFDLAITDGDGLATLYLPPGSTDLRITPPVGSRLHLLELLVTPPVNLGDVELTSGPTVAGRVIDVDENPLHVGEVSGSPSGGGQYFDVLVRRDGRWRGPVEAGQEFNINIRPEFDTLTDLFFFSDGSIGRDRILYPSGVVEPAGRIEGTIRDAETLTPLPGVGVSGLSGPPFFENTGFAQTCDDGTYSMKVADGLHHVLATPFSIPDLLDGWYSPGTSPGDFCSQDSELVPVTAGATTGGIDVELDARSGISGSVTVFGQPEAGATVEISQGRLGSCVEQTFTFGNGIYSREIPAGTGYRVEALAPPSIGGPSICWDDEPGCGSFTPVELMPLSTTSGIDFDFGFAPPEISGFSPLTLLAIGDGLFELTFDQPVPEQHADAFNIYEGNLGTFGTATFSDCHRDPATLSDNGNGTWTHIFEPTPGAEWFLVSASNPFAEGPLGSGRVLSNACGAEPGAAAAAAAGTDRR